MIFKLINLIRWELRYDLFHIHWYHFSCKIIIKCWNQLLWFDYGAVFHRNFFVHWTMSNVLWNLRLKKSVFRWKWNITIGATAILTSKYMYLSLHVCRLIHKMSDKISKNNQPLRHFLCYRLQITTNEAQILTTHFSEITEHFKEYY